MTDYQKMNIHQKMEMLAEEIVDNELPMNEATCEFKKILIKTAAKKYNGTKTTIAEALGIHRNTLNHLIKKLKLKIK